MGLEMRDLFPQRQLMKPLRSPKVSVAELAAYKGFTPDFLRELGVEDHQGEVRITYRLEDGTPAPRHRLRRALAAKRGSTWTRGEGRIVPYGMWELTRARNAGFLVLVEGESDTWTLLYHGFPVLGIPGATMAHVLQPEHLQGIHRIYMVQEPDTGGSTFVRKILERLGKLCWEGTGFTVVLPDGIEDPNELHRKDPESFKSRFQEILDSASQVYPEQTKRAPKPADAISSYRREQDGLYHLKATRDGEVPVRLTNFTAEITADVRVDDGAEVHRRFEIATELNGVRSRFTVPTTQFASMNWVVEHLGSGAIVFPGNTNRDHARTAIQMLSTGTERRTIYAHVGWRKHNNDWIYLHSGGAIGSQGPVAGIEVELPTALQQYRLPEPDEAAAIPSAMRASLRMLDLAPKRVTVPLYASIWRALLGGIDCSIHLTGQTGEGKSELAALVQQHFGEAMNARHLPASWISTGNALESLAFQAKDAVMVVDDFAPTGTSYDVQRLHREADRLLRAQGNHAARQRLRPDTSQRPEKPPRGMIVSTGEDVPRGHSLRARLFVLELGVGELRWDRLSACQKDAAEGKYALLTERQSRR